MKKFLYFAFLGLNLFLLGQTNGYKTYPYNPNSNPLHVRVNVIVLERNDGTGSYNLKDPEERDIFMRSLQFVNWVYSSFQPPKELEGCYTGNEFYPDMGIRMDFNVIEVKNNYYWNLLNSGGNPAVKNLKGFSPSENWYLKPLDDSICASPNIPKGINLYLPENGDIFDDYVYHKKYDLKFTGIAASEFPSYTNFHRSSQVNWPNRYIKYILHKNVATKEYNKPWSVTQEWHISDARALAHEFGHSFGLGHSCEYYRTNQCQYSLMSQKGGAPRNWLPPSEIRKAHYNLTRSNLMQFVTEDSYYGTNMVLKKDTVFTQKRRYYSDIELENGVTLTVEDTLILPKQATLKLNRNSNLILQNKGVILDAYGKAFQNIKKHRKATISKN